MSNDYKIKPIKSNQEKGIFNRDNWVVSTDNLASLIEMFKSSALNLIRKSLILKCQFHELRVNENFEKRSKEPNG